MSRSNLLRIAVALAMLFTVPIADAQTRMVCGPNGCRMVSAQPVRTVVRSTVAAPVRVVRRGLLGRRYSMQPQATQSYGSSGGYTSYQATTQSYGSSGGTAVYQSSVPSESYGSNGGTGSYGDGPTQSRATAAPVTKEAPAASVPLSKSKSCPCGDACDCGPDCQCQTQVCTVPAAAPSTRYCVVPPVSVSSTCRVPSSGPSVEAVAAL